VKLLRGLVEAAYAYRWELAGFSGYRGVEQLAETVVVEFRRAGMSRSAEGRGER